MKLEGVKVECKWNSSLNKIDNHLNIYSQQEDNVFIFFFFFFDGNTDWIIIAKRKVQQSKGKRSSTRWTLVWFVHHIHRGTVLHHHTFTHVIIIHPPYSNECLAIRCVGFSFFLSFVRVSWEGYMRYSTFMTLCM